MTQLAPALVLAERAVPRYTSYPTAPHFKPETSGQTAAWLAELSEDAHLSLDLHVPYCRDLCLYCGCNTKKAVRDDVITAYRAALEREKAVLTEQAQASGKPAAVIEKMVEGRIRKFYEEVVLL